MDIKLNQAYSFHQVGDREYQEDARFPDMDKPSPNQRFFIVCDGVGGCDKGEVASQTVCAAIGKAMRLTDFKKDFTNADFNRVLDTAYDALDRKATPENREMATTLSFVCFHGGGCTMAHIGDSRVYHIRLSEGILYRSEDHSMVNSMVHNGMLTPEQAINHPQGNVITRYMEPVEPDENRCMATVMRTVNVKGGDYFFLCSDGVLHCISDDKLIEILESDESDETKMRKIATRCENSEDNNTACLISVACATSGAVMAEKCETHDDASHYTRRIKATAHTLEEIESIQVPSLWERIKRMFNL